jgi:dTDP-4-amino-4,6-dideoxygalactose transaminase
VSQVHERNDKHKTVQKYKTFLPTLDRIINNVVCIPVGWWVSEEDREYIANQIKKGW